VTGPSDWESLFVFKRCVPPPGAVRSVVVHAARGDDDEHETATEERKHILAKLCPPVHNASIKQDLLENRFFARYEVYMGGVAAARVEDPSWMQDSFGRSYKAKRTPREALSIVLDWIWGKHCCLTRVVRPACAHIDSLPVAERDLLLNPKLGTLKRAKQS
jgi:hypothetical protein